LQQQIAADVAAAQQYFSEAASAQAPTT